VNGIYTHSGNLILSNGWSIVDAATPITTTLYSKNPYPYVGQITEVKNKNMENLYNVIVVDKERNILIDEKTVAKNEETAKFESGVYEYLSKNELSLNEVTVIVNQLGRVEVGNWVNN